MSNRQYSVRWVALDGSPRIGDERLLVIPRGRNEADGVLLRAGIDRAWVGANKGRSYFTHDVDPGRHQVCADWQRILYGQVSVDTFTAEPGKIYYFMIRVTRRTRNDGDHERKDERVRLIRLGESDLSVAEIYR